MTEQGVATFIVFEGQARAAMARYAEIFGDGWVQGPVTLREGDLQGATGPVVHATAVLRGHRLTIVDSGAAHGFSLNPAISLWVDCADQDELDRLWAGLEEGGRTYMPRGNYGFAPCFGWVGDRFGVTWQLCAGHPTL
ncbi:VOC family protein [Arsenicicoccus dermatophilus]|uniref:VOC family protein n=1 Tax=Arsenicicoccus dermatophilus TaxID=1076331 RepID=UPI001F4D03C2|nr:VOC family protein [Arsenicicoccus dermatophilus]MCH8612444.1 VOC family protein [Arsenicicoccus dermatophilus]